MTVSGRASSMAVAHALRDKKFLEMSQSLTLDVPDELATRAQAEAAKQSRPVQAVLVDWLQQAGADDLESLPDSQLLNVCDSMMTASQQAELSELSERNREERLSAADRARFATLMASYQHGLLRQARALRIAVSRGLRTSLD